MKTKLLCILLLLQTSVFAFQEQANDTIAYSQRQFQDKFQDKYSGEEFNYEPKTDVKELSAWDRFWRAVSQFFEDLFDFGNVNQSLDGLDILFRIIAFAIIAFVTYMIVRIIINKESGWIFSKSSTKINVSENDEQNIHQINFASSIETALQQKNYRVAVRYYYLWLLKSLTDSNKIEWDIEKTNTDYLKEIQNADLKDNFRFLSYIYEYSWYGEFELNETDFKKAETAFVKTINAN